MMSGKTSNTCLKRSIGLKAAPEGVFEPAIAVPFTCPFLQPRPLSGSGLPFRSPRSHDSLLPTLVPSRIALPRHQPTRHPHAGFRFCSFKKRSRRPNPVSVFRILRLPAPLSPSPLKRALGPLIPVNFRSWAGWGCWSSCHPSVNKVRLGHLNTILLVYKYIYSIIYILVYIIYIYGHRIFRQTSCSPKLIVA